MHIPDQSTFGLLLRGQTHRWGCHDWSIALQQKASASHVTKVVQPLEAAGHHVRVILALDRGCGRAAYRMLAREYGGPRLVALMRTVGPSSTQAENIRAAINLYLSSTVVGSNFLVLLRYDLTLHRPISTWGMHPQRLGIASQCESWAWNMYNCSSDILFVVPQPLLSAFNTSVGDNLDWKLEQTNWLHRARRCCFMAACIKGGSGHGCYNVLGHHPRIGYSQLSFLFDWPPVTPANPTGLLISALLQSLPRVRFL